MSGENGSGSQGFKPSSERFPVEAAVQFGYDETKFFPKREEKSLAALFVENPEKLPPPDEWLKEKRTDSEKAEYAAFIVEKHFIRADLKVRRERSGYAWITFASVLDSHIGKLAEAGEHRSMLQSLLAELTDFYEAATGRSFANYLFRRLRGFGEDACYRRLVPFLPAQALEKMEEEQKNPPKNLAYGS